MSGKQARILLLVHPGAARNEVVNFADGSWQVRVAAPPVKGKANRELVAFLSQELGVSKGSITIISGHARRRKSLTIAGLTQDEVIKRLSPRPSSGGATTSSRPRPQ